MTDRGSGNQGRVGALEELLRELEPTDESESDVRVGDDWFDAATMLVVDAIVDADAKVLAVASTRLADAADRADEAKLVGRLSGLSDVARWGEERRGFAAFPEIEAGSYAEKMMLFIADSPGISNDEISERLGVDPSEVSRTGSRLHADGLASSHRMGRRNAWELTHRGLEVLERLRSDRLEFSRVSASPRTKSTVEGAGVKTTIERSAELFQSLVANLAAVQQRQQGSPLKNLRTDAFEFVVRPLRGKFGAVSQLRVVVTADPDGDSKSQRRDGDEYLATLVPRPQLLPSDAVDTTPALEVNSHPRGVSVSWEKSQRPLRVFETKSDAVKFATAKAKERGAKIVFGVDTDVKGSKKKG